MGWAIQDWLSGGFLGLIVHRWDHLTASRKVMGTPNVFCRCLQVESLRVWCSSPSLGRQDHWLAHRSLCCRDGENNCFTGPSVRRGLMKAPWEQEARGRHSVNCGLSLGQCRSLVMQKFSTLSTEFVNATCPLSSEYLRYLSHEGRLWDYCLTFSCQTESFLIWGWPWDTEWQTLCLVLFFISHSMYSSSAVPSSVLIFLLPLLNAI